ncbi:MAG: LTA synthase family protein [Chitinophagaceae bacterium]
MTVFKRIFLGKFAPAVLLLFLSCVISLLTRIVLLIYSGSSVDYSFLNVTGIFSIGLFYDLCMSSFLIIPLVLHIWLTNEKSYQQQGKWIMIAIYAVLIVLVAFFKIIPEEYNKIVPLIVLMLIILRLLIYLFLLYKGAAFRKKWRTNVLLIDLFVIVYFLFFNAISEFFFWQEFGNRYNFIAVDYLVYTNEVAGNVNESYPIGWIITGVLLATVPVVWASRKIIYHSVNLQRSFARRTVIAILFLLIPVIVYFTVTNRIRKFSSNEYVNELAGNGLYEFGAAFLNNELDFYKFYQTLPDKEAFAIVREELKAPNATFISDDLFNLERDISYNAPEEKHNIVLISVESFSASFMKAFGETRNLTPQLDSLASQSIFFTNLYATGTRTVRGLECLSLSIPPVPGQSVVRRPGNEELFSLGALLKSKGYTTQFIYGGYSSFDNMGYYFSHNNYEVIDRSAIPPDKIHYANIWGVADEDLFTMALSKLDSNYASGKPFFSQIMTVSNHRPYTYPDGRIDIPPSQQSREGAVKYTDYAIGRFLREAKSKPWFNNTIFVVVADHCAYAAGKVELPVTGYHIPMLIYSPALIKPQSYDRLISQMDIIPTLLGMLKMKYRTKFFGQDIFSLPEGKERAFISTYQGLGYIRNGQLIVQRPPKKIDQFIPDFSTGKASATGKNDSLIKQAIAYYQAAAWLLKNKKYGKE